jgi:spore maturation protein SpmA
LAFAGFVAGRARGIISSVFGQAMGSVLVFLIGIVVLWCAIFTLPEAVAIAYFDARSKKGYT